MVHMVPTAARNIERRSKRPDSSFLSKSFMFPRSFSPYRRYLSRWPVLIYKSGNGRSAVYHSKAAYPQPANRIAAAINHTNFFILLVLLHRASERLHSYVEKVCGGYACKYSVSRR